MSEPARIRLFCEGHEEFVVLQAISQEGVLPSSVEVSRPGTRPGRPSGAEGVVYDASVELALEGTQSIAVLDFDDTTMEQVAGRFATRLRQELPGREVFSAVLDARIAKLTVHGGGMAAIVAVGLQGEEDITRRDINWFAFDDYLVRLACDEAIYRATSQLNEFPYEKAVHKLGEISHVMRQNGVPLDKTKRILQMLMGVTGFRPSPATLAERLVQAAIAVHGKEAAVALLQPLIDDVAAAVLFLRSQSQD